MLWISLFLTCVFGQATIDYKKFLDEVNAIRAKYNAPAICLSDKLIASAGKHSVYQASIDQLTHDSPTPLMQRFTNEGFQPLSVAENVAQNGSLDVVGASNLLVSDQAHLDNVIKSDHTHCGFGAAQVGNKVYWTQHFAKARNPASEPCSAGTAPAAGATPSTAPTAGAAPATGTPATGNGPAAAGAAPAASTPAASAPATSPQNQLNSLLGGLQVPPPAPAQPPMFVVAPPTPASPVVVMTSPDNSLNAKNFNRPPAPPCQGPECDLFNGIIPPPSNQQPYPAAPFPAPVGSDSFGRPIFR